MNEKPQVVTVYLSKGGVGKSTLVMLMGYFLAALGYRVVILDLDRQGSQSTFFDLVDATGRSAEVLHQVIKRRVDAVTAITPISTIPTLDGFTPGSLGIIQGGPQTAIAIEDVLSSPVTYRVANPLDLIGGVITQLSGCADYVLIDMGPGDQMAALVGLTATDKLIIPTTMDYPSVTRIATVLDEVSVAQQNNPALEVVGIVPMMTRYYFGGLRKSQTVQAGEQFLKASYAPLLLTGRGDAMLDFPYNEDINKAIWAGIPILSNEVSATARAEVLHLLNGLASRMGMAEVAHV